MPKIDVYAAVMKRVGVLRVAEASATNACQAALVMCAFLQDAPAERIAVAYLSAQGTVLGVECVAMGGGASCLVSPAECYRGAIAHGATAILLAHNHPSGDPTPSRQDIEMTRELARAGKVIGISLVDHLVVTRSGGWTSIRDVAPAIFDDGEEIIVLMRGLK